MTATDAASSLTWPAPRITREAIARSLRTGLESLRALPPMRLSEWAQQHFIMAGESSQQRGAWVAWPFQVGIMDAMSHDDIEELTVFKAKRLGYTKMLTASVGFDAAWRRRNQALYQPTDDDRDSFVKTELDPVLDAVPAIRAARRQSKAADDTIKYKLFRDSVAHFLGGKAARAYRRITVAVVKLDELEAFDRQIEKTADPVTLARGRLEGAPFPKLIAGSTPGLKGLSHLEDRAAVADVDMRYHVVCPHCDMEHPLLWGGKKLAHGFKWDNGDPATVRHVCPHCHDSITQADYLRHWTGAWVCQHTGTRYGADQIWRNVEGEPIKAPRHVVMRPWAALSPQREWSSIVREFLEAQTTAKAGDTGALRGFVNETLGETWEERGDSADEHELARRAEPYPLRVVPMGGLMLVAGVDVQDNRFEVVVWAIGRGEEMWCVDYAVLYANPGDEQEWVDKLDAYLQTPVQHASGGWLQIEATAVDTGGHFTHPAYVFARQREQRRVFAVKGESQAGKPIAGKPTLVDVNHRGRVLPRGCKLWWVGTDTAKDLLLGRLGVERHGPGYVHFSHQLPPEFFAGMAAEQRVRVRTAQGEVYRWVNPNRRRNEPLDATIYSLFCVFRLGLDRYTANMWQRLEDAVVPPAQLDLLAATAPTAPPAPASVPPADAASPPPQAIPALQQARPMMPRPGQLVGRFSIASAAGRFRGGAA